LQANLYVLLLTPAIALIMAGGLAVLWYHRPAARFIRMAAFGMALLALAFLIFDILPELPAGLTSLLGNLCFLGTFTLVSIAVVQMSGGRVPLAALSAILVGTVLAVIWWLYVDYDTLRRVNAMNISHALMALVSLLAISQSPSRGWSRNGALLVAALAFLNFVWRPLLVMLEGSDYGTHSELMASIYWNATRFGSPIIAVFATLALVVGLIVAMVDELKLEARTDKLSNCLNRRGFEEQCLAVIADMARRPRSMTMVVADIDRFKLINDNYGHAVGDEVIRTFAAALRTIMPSRAVVGRIGGEEFAVLLSDRDAPDAQGLTAACRAEFSSLLLAARLQPATASYGIYHCEDSDDLQTMLDHADAALYEAKSSGRNCIRTHRLPPLGPVAMRPVQLPDRAKASVAQLGQSS